jgi:hypothetical protein
MRFNGGGGVTYTNVYDFENVLGEAGVLTDWMCYHVEDIAEANSATQYCTAAAGWLSGMSTAASPAEIMVDSGNWIDLTETGNVDEAMSVGLDLPTLILHWDGSNGFEYVSD